MLPAISRETQDKLDIYAAPLTKWQAKINLVSPSTLADAKIRHFDDSLQLLTVIPVGAGIHDAPDSGIRRGDNLVLVDLGSGAGFPGLLLAIAQPELDVHLVESDAKKCEFMRTVSRETGTPVTIHNKRIEALPPFPVDVMTARALAPLNVLLAHALPFTQINPSLQMLFLKGANWQDEIRFARELYTFDLTETASITAKNSVILQITNLSHK